MERRENPGRLLVSLGFVGISASVPQRVSSGAGELGAAVAASREPG